MTWEITLIVGKPIFFFCLLCLLIKPVEASSGRKRYTFLPPLGGLNTSVSPIILDPKQLTAANNVIYDHVGSRKKRGGTLYLNETPIEETSGSNTIMGIFDYASTDSNGIETRKLVCHSDGKIYKMDNFDGTWDNISSGPFTINKLVDYAVLRQVDTTTDTLIAVNGAELPQTWQQSQSATNNLSGYPTGIDFYPSCIEAHKTRLFATGVPSYPFRIFFSASYKYNDWNTVDDAGYTDIIDPIGSKNTGLVGNYYDYLIVFTETSIYRISGTSYDDFAVAPTPVFASLGAINQQSIIPYGNDIFFVSKQGIHSLSTTEKYGNIRETYLSAPIQNDFHALNPNRLKYCVGAVFPELNYIIWSFTQATATTNDICLVYDYIGQRWSKWDNINASCFAVVKSNVNKYELLSGNYDGYVNRLNRENINDNGSSYQMNWATPYINFSDPILSKTFKDLFIFLKPNGNTDIRVSYIVDNYDTVDLTFNQQGTSATLGSFILGSDVLGAGTLVPKSKHLTGSGKTIKLTFEASGADVGSEIYGYAIELIPGQVDYSN